MAIFAILVAIFLLVVLVGWLKTNPFLGFLAAAIVAACISGIPPEQIPGVLEAGIGSMLGSLAIILCVGAMFGKLISESGAAQQISRTLIAAFGQKNITWALMITGFIVGIPLYYNVGFVLLVPLVFSVMYQSKLPGVYLAIPLLAGLSTTHGFLPPHPSPVALIPQFGASIGATLLYGLIIAIPTVIIAGPLLATRLKHIQVNPLKTFCAQPLPEESLPTPFTSFFCALLPVLLIAAASLLPVIAPGVAKNSWVIFLSNPSIVLLLGLIVATYSLGIARGVSIEKIMQSFTDGLKDISIIVLILAGAGALKQVFVTSGVSNELGSMLQQIPLNPLVLAWLIATVIRIALGSATVAGITAAGIVAPLVVSSGANPNLMVLAVGAGSLMCSHVNDSGFWMYKEYFNLSLKDTFKSWSLMETVIGVMGIIGVLILDAFI
ncbi:GntP family permease [Cellvibrio sp.]|uniref:GntP family permease n=1 Tax=Cellvibrio sp. TaxID=1965322 RepID=UPI0039647DEF